MTPLHQQVRRTIARHALCPPGTNLLVGISGGSDSVALTLLMRDLSPRGGFRVAALAHLNHRLRPTAGRDEQLCRQLAARLELPILVESVDVAGYAAVQHLSVEAAARRVRYDFLHRACGQADADRIAVGHTQDDQAETVLLKLIRGAGLTGLAGIYPRRGAVIRPLLDVTRADLRSYLSSQGAIWAEDESNEDVGNPRNRIRHRVIPELERAYGPATSANIARTAALAREDGQYLDEIAQSRYFEVAVQASDGIEIDVTALRRDPPPVRRRVVLQAMKAVAGEREIGQDHVEAALQVMDGLCAGLDAPGARVELRRGKLVLFHQGRGPR